MPQAVRALQEEWHACRKRHRDEAIHGSQRLHNGPGSRRTCRKCRPGAASRPPVTMTTSIMLIIRAKQDAREQRRACLYRERLSVSTVKQQPAASCLLRTPKLLIKAVQEKQIHK